VLSGWVASSAALLDFLNAGRSHALSQRREPRGRPPLWGYLKTFLVVAVPLALAVALSVAVTMGVALPATVAVLVLGISSPTAATVVLALVLAVVDVVPVAAALSGLEEAAVTRASASMRPPRQRDPTNSHAGTHKQRYCDAHYSAWLH
jgi:hypothetical protein